MPVTKAVAKHYALENLTETIVAGLETLGKRPETATIDDLAPVDEFHVGGRQATEAFVSQLGFSPHHNILDIGCGLGGSARYTAQATGCRVTGIDVTQAFIETGNQLCEWVGIENRITLQQGSALDMPYAADSFDGAMMLHVGMNIPDKPRLFAEVARVLRPGSVFGVYDIMKTGAEEVSFPVPWAAGPETSALAPPEHYRETLETAGFEVTGERNRHGFAVAFFDALSKRVKAAGGPPPLGLHITMGPEAPAKIANMVRNIGEGRIAPVEMIARLPG